MKNVCRRHRIRSICLLLTTNYCCIRKHFIVAFLFEVSSRLSQLLHRRISKFAFSFHSQISLLIVKSINGNAVSSDMKYCLTRMLADALKYFWH